MPARQSESAPFGQHCAEIGPVTRLGDVVAVSLEDLGRGRQHLGGVVEFTAQVGDNAALGEQPRPLQRPGQLLGVDE